jgi:TPR repeat protein
MAGTRASGLLAAAVSASLALAAAAARAATFADGLAAEQRGDLATAAQAYREAAGRGEAPAEFALGRMYADGQGVPRDLTQALMLFRAAAQKGNPGAQFRLAAMMATGDGAPKDNAQAGTWLMKSAAGGYAPAQLKLAELYARGAGVSRDIHQAAEWAGKAAAQGDVQAQATAGKLYAQAWRAGGSGRGGPGMTNADFHAVMDDMFGAGAWRETSGYRTRAQENALRAEGAGTVPVGVLSHHSMGAPGRPGAYDVVMRKGSNASAAARLKNSGMAFQRVIVEGQHGPEGPHLHIEPGRGGRSGQRAEPASSVIDALVNGPTPLSGPDYDRWNAIYWLGIAAAHGSAESRTLLNQIAASHGG